MNRPTYTATNSSKLRQYVGNKLYENGSLKRILLDNGYIEGGIYYFYLRDHLGNNSVVAKADGQVVQRNHYYPYGKTIGNGESWGQAAQPYKFGGKEEETMFGLELYDFHARQMDRRIPGFLGVDPLCEKYYSISPYAYCAGNPVNIIDKDGREWTYVVDANGHTTINVALNFSVSGSYTVEQINAYKNAIAAQFNSTISEVSGGAMSGTITFYEGNQNIVQTLALDKMDGAIGGETTFFNSSVNLVNKAGELRSLSDVGSDATHEMLHTVRLEHPFETTQTEDTKLLRVAPNSFVSTSTTDANIVNNVMSYPMITVDGQKSTNQNSLTKGQLQFMLKEINLQNQGYGFMPKYDSKYTTEEYNSLTNKYYVNYWTNFPGTPVGNK